MTDTISVTQGDINPCLDCREPVRQKPGRGRPRLRCPECAAAYKTALNKGTAQRHCPTCGVQIRFGSKFTYCPKHRPVSQTKKPETTS